MTHVGGRGGFSLGCFPLRPNMGFLLIRTRLHVSNTCKVIRFTHLKHLMSPPPQPPMRRIWASSGNAFTVSCTPLKQRLKALYQYCCIDRLLVVLHFIVKPHTLADTWWHPHTHTHGYGWWDAATSEDNDKTVLYSEQDRNKKRWFYYKTNVWAFLL